VELIRIKKNYDLRFFISRSVNVIEVCVCRFVLVKVTQ